MFKANPDTVYLTDNGAALCGEHLGTTALYTGRDLSGQPIMPITPEVLAEARATGFEPTCEHCGKQADDAEVFAKNLEALKSGARPLSDILVAPPKRKVRAIVGGR